jgi:hypothetical protein
MESPSRVFAGATRAPSTPCSPVGSSVGTAASYAAASYLEKLREDCRLARAARVNLLLVHSEGDIRNLLERLKLDLREPIVTWRTGEKLVLPPVAWAGTMILQDVGALGQRDQLGLLDWLGRSAGRTQVISTTPTPLWPRVQAGVFLDSLYYRLNTMCVDVVSRLRSVRFTGNLSAQ